MFQKLTATLSARTTARTLAVVTAALVAALVTVQILDAPWSLVRLERLAGTRAIPDMELHYSVRGVYDILGALGAVGRRFYLTRVLGGFDVVFPSLAALWGGMAMTLVVRRLKAGGAMMTGALHWLPLLPFAAGAFDYLENAALATLVMTFPSPHPYIAVLAGSLTTLKQIGYLGTVVLLVAGMGAVLLHRRSAACRVSGTGRRCA
ncbi:MAG: hypothetical protein ABJF01_19145 [bacterium]